MSENTFVQTDNPVNTVSDWTLPHDWRIAKIADLCLRVTSGATPLRGNPLYHENGTISWFKTGELKDWYLGEAEEKITQKAVQETSAKLFPPNTILMAMYGDGKTITSLGILKEEATSNQACCAMIVDPRVCNHLYLFYALKYHRLDFIHSATGGAQRNLSGQIIKNFAIRVPPLETQRAIAHILGTLDDKIENNRRINKTLEDMAKAIFKSWFVDFDPVRAKAQGRQPEGIDAETAALFPDGFEDSELGEIPRGWRVGKLGEVMLSPRRSVNPSSINPETPYIGLEHMPRHSIALCEWGYAQDVESQKLQFKQGEILFGKLRPYFHKVAVAPVDGVASSDIIIITTSPEWFGFVLGHVSSNEFVDFTNRASTGTRMPRANWVDMASYPIVIPTVDAASYFTEHMQSVVKSIRQNIFESNELKSLRDFLLPKLLSGDLPIKDAEEYLGEVD